MENQNNSAHVIGFILAALSGAIATLLMCGITYALISQTITPLEIGVIVAFTCSVAAVILASGAGKNWK
jgi:hypothetical protein